MLSLLNLSAVLPASQWGMASQAAEASAAMLAFTQAALPRLAISLLAGAALGITGAVLQQALRNPLADATTLGLSAGAALALAAAGSLAPRLLDLGETPVATAGAGLAALLVFGLAWRSGFAALALVLMGLVVSLLCGALAAMLAVLQHDQLSALALWQAGFLQQSGWRPSLRLLAALIGAGLLLALLRRPLAMLDLGDAQATALGIPVTMLRLASLLLAVLLGAICVGAVGMLGLVGVFAPNVARLLGATRFDCRMGWAALLGALLVWLTDQAIQAAGGAMPTGSATALLSAPTLIWAARRQASPAPRPTLPPVPPLLASRLPPLLVAAVSLACLAVALAFGRGVEGWAWLSPADASAILPWRWPRVLVALSAGSLLAMAGMMLQRVTGNAMASPELLGISAGAGLGVVAVMVLSPAFSRLALTGGAGLGAAAALATAALFGARPGAPPERLLLVGLALATILGAATTLLLTSGDPRAATLWAWLAGSSYRATPADALFGMGMVCLLLVVAPALLRWLAILPLGAPASRGVGAIQGQPVVLAMICLASAGATLIMGPMSFIGLIGPHLARASGLRRPLPQLLGAALTGGLVLMMADWAGRNLLFPWQIPGGLVASLTGLPLLLAMMWRRR
jgi:iron complex transport system permease protein